MNQDSTSFQSAKSIISQFKGDKPRYQISKIVDALRAGRLDVMETATAFLESQDDDEILLALQLLATFDHLDDKSFNRLLNFLVHENLEVRLAAVDPFLKNAGVSSSATVVFETWIYNYDPISKAVGAYAIGTLNPKQVEPMSRLLAGMLSALMPYDHFARMAAFKGLIQLDFEDESIIESMAEFLIPSVNATPIFGDPQMLQLLADRKLIIPIARCFLAKDEYGLSTNACYLLTQQKDFADEATIAKVRSLRDTDDVFLSDLAERALAIIEPPS